MKGGVLPVDGGGDDVHVHNVEASVLPVDRGGDDINIHYALLRGILHYGKGGVLLVDGGGDDVNIHAPYSLGSFTMWKGVSYRWMEEGMTLTFMMPCSVGSSSI